MISLFLLIIMTFPRSLCYDYTLYVSPTGTRNGTTMNCSSETNACTFPQAVDYYSGICFGTNVEIVFLSGKYDGDSWMTEKEPKLWLFVMGGSLTMISYSSKMKKNPESNDVIISWTTQGKSFSVLVEIAFKYYQGQIGDFKWEGIDVFNNSTIGPLINIFEPFGHHPRTATFRNFKVTPIVPDLGGGFCQGADGEGCDISFAVLFDNVDFSVYEQSFWSCPDGNLVVIKNSQFETCSQLYITSVSHLQMIVQNSKFSSPVTPCSSSSRNNNRLSDTFNEADEDYNGGIWVTMLDNGPSIQSHYDILIENSEFAGYSSVKFDLDSYYNPPMPTRTMNVNLTFVSFVGENYNNNGYIRISKKKDRYYDASFGFNYVTFDRNWENGLDIVGNSAGRAEIVLGNCCFGKNVKNVAKYYFDSSKQIQTHLNIVDTKIKDSMGIVLGFG